MIRNMLCAVSLCWLCVPMAAQQKHDIERELYRFVNFSLQLTSQEVPGYLVGVVVEDSVYYFPFGTLHKQGTAVPGLDSIFEIGDLTKTFTAALLCKLEAEGLLSLTDSLNRHLPAQRARPGPTLIQLLTHTAGLPRVPPGFDRNAENWKNPYSTYEVASLLSDYAGMNVAPGRFSYSQTGFALLEPYLKEKAGTDFESLLQRSLLQPLGLTGMYVTWTPHYPRPAPAYFSGSLNEQPAWTFATFAPALGLKSSVRDLARFVQWQWTEDQPWKSVFIRLRQVYCPTEMNAFTEMAPGWYHIRKRNQHHQYANTGVTGGHRAFMGFVPETKTGVVVLGNSNSRKLNEIGFYMLDFLNRKHKPAKTHK